jgi:hypothetical protein
MSRYTVISAIWASAVREVEAASPEEAARKGAGAPSVCCHCSAHVQIDEVEHVTVFDEDDEIVWTDAEPALRVASDEDLAAEIERRKSGAR